MHSRTIIDVIFAPTLIFWVVLVHFLKFTGGHSFDHLELAIEIRDIGETAVITNGDHFLPLLDQKFTGIAHPDLIKIPREGLIVNPFEKSAKGGRVHMSDLSDGFQFNGFCKVLKDVLIDLP